MKIVYELVDNTDDEQYFPLGLFETKEEAVYIVHQADSDGCRVGDSGDNDMETITVFERELGMSGAGKTVYTADRYDTYNEEADEYLWQTERVKDNEL